MSCGDAASPTAETDGAAASPDSAAQAATELFDTDFHQVCRETGQPAAAAFVAGPGVHPLLLMASDDGTEYRQLSTTLPEGWGAVWPDLERTELVACARQVSATPGQVCEGYSDEDSGQKWTVQTHAVVYEYTVRVARTAEELARTTFEVPAGDCPMFSVYTDGSPQPQPYFPDAGSGAVELFVRPFVTGN